MSTPSKRRRKARAWMHWVTLSQKIEVDILRRSFESELARLRPRATNPDEIWPCPMPSELQRVMKIAGRPQTPETFQGQALNNPFGMVSISMLIEAKEMKLPLPDGRSVRWLAWELR